MRERHNVKIIDNKEYVLKTDYDELYNWSKTRIHFYLFEMLILFVLIVFLALR